MVFNKKRAFFQNKMTESIGKPKDLWKALKSLWQPNKVFSCQVKALKINNTVEHDVNSALELFKSFYSTLAANFEKLLPKPPNKYSMNTVIKYFEHVIQVDNFSKVASLDNLSGRFLKDGAKFLSKPISDLCNLSINSEKLPNSCKVVKLKPLNKKVL